MIIILKASHIELYIWVHLLVHSLTGQDDQGWARLKLKVVCLIQVPQMSSKIPSPWTILYCISPAINREVHHKLGIRDSNWLSDANAVGSSFMCNSGPQFHLYNMNSFIGNLSALLFVCMGITEKFQICLTNFWWKKTNRKKHWYFSR